MPNISSLILKGSIHAKLVVTKHFWESKAPYMHPNSPTSGDCETLSPISSGRKEKRNQFKVNESESDAEKKWFSSLHMRNMWADI